MNRVINLHQSCIEILEAVNTYNKLIGHATTAIESVNKYIHWDNYVARKNHDIEIYRMVIARLMSRHENAMQKIVSLTSTECDVCGSTNTINN